MEMRKSTKLDVVDGAIFQHKMSGLNFMVIHCKVHEHNNEACFYAAGKYISVSNAKMILITYEEIEDEFWFLGIGDASLLNILTRSRKSNKSAESILNQWFT